MTMFVFKESLVFFVLIQLSLLLVAVCESQIVDQDLKGVPRFIRSPKKNKNNDASFYNDASAFQADQPKDHRNEPHHNSPGQQKKANQHKTSPSFINVNGDVGQNINGYSDVGNSNSKSKHHPNANANSNSKKPKKPKKNKRVSESKHTEYILNVFNDENFADDLDDDDFDGRELAHPGQYPHMAAIGFRAEGGPIYYQCGGSLISENFVITAAHCTKVSGIEASLVRVGDLNLNVDEANIEPQIRNIALIMNHPKYQDESYYHDIALLQLGNQVQLTRYVFPIRLWVYPDIPYDTAYAMGYGATAFAKAYTNRLTDLNMTIVSNPECNSQMPLSPESALGIIESQICAKDFLKNRDTCQGDSGGPLQLNIVGKRQKKRTIYHLIGITSYGMVCRTTYPGVYTRISYYLDWIENNVWK